MPGILDANGQPIDPTADPAAAGTPTPDAEKAAELAQLRETIATLQGNISELRGALDYATRAPAPTPPPVAPEPEITDDEINAAFRDDEGNAAAKVRLLAERLNKKTEERLRAEVTELRAAGLSSIAEVAAAQASNTLPHFKAFEKEIKAAVSKLDPALQARADTWRFAHDAIVGANHDVLMQQAIEAERRQNRDAAGSPSTPGAGADAHLTDSKGNKVATVEQLGGEDARKALSVKGISEDELARRMGYQGWADYLEKTSNLEEAGR